MSQYAWSKELGLSNFAITMRRKRLMSRGIKPTVEDLLKPKYRKEEVKHTYQGETLTLKEWSKRSGLPLDLLLKRHRNGVKAFLSKKRKTKTLTYNGQTRTITEWAEKLGLTRIAIYYRLKKSSDLDYVLSRKHHR